MKYIIENQVIDTYGGNFSYRDVWYEVENNEYTFYETISTFDSEGNPITETGVIINTNEINELMKSI